MRNKPPAPFLQIKPGTLLAPTPVVMVSCAGETTAQNIITAAWAGVVNSDPPMLSISVRPERYSHDLILESKEFVVNLVSRDLAKACDFCGVRSGREVDKFAHLKLDPVKVQELTYAPAIAQSPAYLACKLEQTLSLGSHTLMIGRVVAVGVAPHLMDSTGKIDFNQARLVAYSHGDYVGLTKPFGFFGYSIARPEVLARRLSSQPGK